MCASPIRLSPASYKREVPEANSGCVNCAKITVFAIGLILLVVGLLALYGAFGSLDERIGGTVTLLGLGGLAISWYCCSNKPSHSDDDWEAPSRSSTTRANQLRPTWRNNPLSHTHSFSTSHFASPSSEKPSVIQAVMSEPNLFQNLSYDLRNDEDVVFAALSGCKTHEQAKKVIRNACYKAKNSKKVALALVKIAPEQLGLLNYDARNDEDVVAAAINSCKSSEQAKLVISSACYNAKNSKKVALALVKIDPNLLGQLNYDAKNDVEVVLLAIKLSTIHTIDKIWRCVGSKASMNPEVRANVKQKYPHFFKEQTSESEFPNFSKKGTFRGFPFSHTQNPPNKNQTPRSAPRPSWVEPEDLKGDTSEGANIARSILKESHLLAIDLSRTEVSKGTAKSILRRLLGLAANISDSDIKKAYQKAVLRIHPDKFKLKSGEEAFKTLTLAYTQADL